MTSTSDHFLTMQNLGIEDPREADMAWTIFQKDSNFIGSNRLTPESLMSQKYMAERCSQKWDDFCRLYARSMWQRTAFSDDVDKASVGEVFIDNVLKEKYCSLHSGPDGGFCGVTPQQIAPEITNSPTVNLPAGNCVYQCSKNVPDDEVINIAIAQESKNPGVHRSTLTQLCDQSSNIGSKNLLDYCKYAAKIDRTPQVVINPEFRLKAKRRISDDSKKGLIAVGLISTLLLLSVIGYIYRDNIKAMFRK